MRAHGGERAPTGGSQFGRRAHGPWGVVPVFGVTAPWPPPRESNNSVLTRVLRLLMVVMGG